MTVPHEIIELVERFERNAAAYKSAQYNETQLRREFLDPFFEALGWDVNNRQGYAEAYKDVVHEDAIKIGGASKAPDYSFRIGGTRKFFLEAKRPAVNIREDTRPAFQLRRYAWTGGLPLSILTDFEEFAVYDCRIKPAETDKASTARTMFLTYSEYAERWDEIVSVFGREAVLRGAFDRYAEENKGKRGTTTVDAAFLRDISSWRERLARNLALRNDELKHNQRALNFAVQRTIDRIIFLRICEDRGIERYGQLEAIASDADIYENLCRLFHRADERYNSGLFHFQQEKGRRESPDMLTLGLAIDDRVLKEIIGSLYYPAPYEFSVMPADILGQVYEQFLGEVIRLTPSGQAKVEPKPEVRKAGGVYYTPTYIVDYIVRQTVGKLCEGKTPRQVAKLRILDPACGSGLFLAGAYQYLLDWHLEWYMKDGAAKQRKEIYEGAGGAWRLATAERRRILLNNVYGVDIDPQAVEVTKLSLLLKVLEGESEQTLNAQLRMFHERALPDLGDNIKSGNALIGPDLYAHRQTLLLDEEEHCRINAFDWEREFSEIMKAGGFDAVVGNPPYIFARDEGFSEVEKSYFRKFEHQNYQLNTYALFTERCFLLLRAGGHLGFIIPNNWLSLSTMKPFRDFLVGSTGDLGIVNNLYKVFRGANVDTSIVRFEKKPPTEILLIESTRPNEFREVASVDPARLLHEPIIRYRLHRDTKARSLLRKLESKVVRLEEIALVKAGLKAYETGKGQPAQTDRMKRERVYHRQSKPDDSYRRYLEGKDVRRYAICWSESYLKYGVNLAAPRDPSLFQGERILVRQIPSRPPYSINATIVSGEELNDINSMIIKRTTSYALCYLLGIINSKLLTFWFDLTFDKFQRAIFPQFKVNELSRFPIREIDFSGADDKARHALMVETVEQMLALHERLAAVKTAHDRTAIERRINVTDGLIDCLVYELYGLTEDEIKFVEELTAPMKRA